MTRVVKTASACSLVVVGLRLGSAAAFARHHHQAASRSG